MAKKIKKEAECKTIIVEKPKHIVNKTFSIEYNNKTERYVLRNDGQFLMADRDHDTVRRSANKRYGLSDAAWLQEKTPS